MLQDDERDLPAEKKAEPCAVCGGPSGCASWGFRLCYGDLAGDRVGCIDRLAEVMPFENEKQFTTAWVAAQRKAKGRAA